ncbi:MAG: uracil-DNA glycosylase [archaeon]|nr:uracil-DNA glycosylase [archaeon]
MAGKTEAAVLLGAWLESIGLAKHLEAVLAEWGEDVEAVRQATVDDWERVGVTLLTHRRRLVKAASSLPSLHQSTESPLKKQKAHSSSSSSSSSSSFLLSGSNDDDETLVTDLHLPPASVITSIAFPPAGSLVAPMPPQKGEDPLGLWELFEGGAEEWYGQLKGVLARGAAAEFLGPGRSRWVVPGRPFVFQALKARAPGEWSVVVFGQNPYPRMESATGIAMLDNTFSTWADPRFGKVVSMRTIAKAALRWRDPSVPVSTTVADLRARFKRSSVVEPPQWFAAMLSQGVLLLNAALTTTSTDAPSSSDAPTPSAHDKFWQPVVAEILRTIFHHRAATGSGLVFSWWGTKALSLRKKYVDGLALQYPQVPVVHLQHSNPAAQGDTFSNQGSVFQDINDALQQLRLPQVDWLPTKDWFTAHTQQSSASLRMHDFITSTRELHLQFLERLADLKSDVGLSQMLPVADIFTAIPAPKSLRDAVSSVAPKTALEVALKFALRLSPHSMASTNLSPDEIASIHLYVLLP